MLQCLCCLSRLRQGLRSEVHIYYLSTMDITLFKHKPCKTDYKYVLTCWCPLWMQHISCLCTSCKPRTEELDRSKPRTRWHADVLYIPWPHLSISKYTETKADSCTWFFCSSTCSSETLMNNRPVFRERSVVWCKKNWQVFFFFFLSKSVSNGQFQFRPSMLMYFLTNVQIYWVFSHLVLTGLLISLQGIRFYFWFRCKTTLDLECLLISLLRYTGRTRYIWSTSCHVIFPKTQLYNIDVYPCNNWERKISQFFSPQLSKL